MRIKGKDLALVADGTNKVPVLYRPVLVLVLKLTKKIGLRLQRISTSFRDLPSNNYFNGKFFW